MSIWPDREDHEGCERSSLCMKLIPGSEMQDDPCDLSCDEFYSLCPSCRGIRAKREHLDEVPDWRRRALERERRVPRR